MRGFILGECWLFIASLFLSTMFISGFQQLLFIPWTKGQQLLTRVPWGAESTRMYLRVKIWIYALGKAEDKSVLQQEPDCHNIRILSSFRACSAGLGDFSGLLCRGLLRWRPHSHLLSNRQMDPTWRDWLSFVNALKFFLAIRRITAEAFFLVLCLCRCFNVTYRHIGLVSSNGWKRLLVKSTVLLHTKLKSEQILLWH